MAHALASEDRRSGGSWGPRGVKLFVHGVTDAVKAVISADDVFINHFSFGAQR
jgi:hypothetical protein